MDCESEGAGLTTEEPIVNESIVSKSSPSSSPPPLPVLENGDKSSSSDSKSTEVGEDHPGDEDIPGQQKLAEVDSDHSVDEHDHVCKICKDGGDVVCCDTCPHVYHMQCLNPPVSQLPEGDWSCPRCACEPIPGQVKGILTWKWDETEQYRVQYFSAPSSQQKYMAQPRRNYFVHFWNKSYWDCAWVTTIQMQVHHPGMIHAYKTQEEPPQLFHDEDEEQDYYAEFQEGVKNGLKERFYDNGVKPSWLQIHRILSHNKDKKKDSTSYLVKWKDLPYDFATFESLEKCPDPLLLPEFEKQIKIYKEFRHHFESLDSSKKSKKQHKYKHITVGPSKSTCNLKEKFDYEQDLPFIDSAGGLRLHDYQLDGLNWLRYSYANGTPTILADEMGLGKTIQAITFMYSLYKEGHCSGPFLVSAPLSTIVNWERELEIWGPDFYVVTYCGHKESRQVLRQYELTFDEKAAKKLASNQLCKVKGRPKFHVLLTSYEYITKDAICLGSMDWACIIIDEAHRLKSGSSSFFQSLSKYKTKYKLLLTGTPLQNNLIELYHLLNYLSPLKFCDLDEFLSEFSDISKEDQIKRLQSLLGSHMLRRLKIDVLRSMPSKSEFIVRVELSPQQKEFYKHILTRNYDALNSKVGGKKASLITILMELKKCCNHPYLFSAAMMSAPVVNKDKDDERYELEALTASSGKFILLRKMLAKLQEQGHRVLIFSQMTKVLDLLEDFLNGLGYSFERIDGTIRGSDRQNSIDRFNDPKSKSLVFLLSTKAGGLGINLATADTVIIYDSDWNPHNDIQALSRAHRIGQKNKVLIYRFVTRNTIEEKVAHVSKKKMMLNQLIVESNRSGVGAKGSGTKLSLSQQEMQTILKFGVEDLFKDSETTGTIHYTDEVIEKLLDRSEASGDQGTEEKEEHWINDYLQSFKVANYELEPQEKEKPPEEVVVEKKSDQVNSDDPDYWTKVLKISGDSIPGTSSSMFPEELGRGKRQSTYRNLGQVSIVGEKRRGTAEYDDDSGDEYKVDLDMDADSDEDEVDGFNRIKTQHLNNGLQQQYVGQLQGINNKNNFTFPGVPSAYRVRQPLKTFKSPITFSRGHHSQMTTIKQVPGLAKINGRKMTTHQSVASHIRQLLNKNSNFNLPPDSRFEVIVPNSGANNFDPLDGRPSSTNPTAYWKWHQQRQQHIANKNLTAALNELSSSGVTIRPRVRSVPLYGQHNPHQQTVGSTGARRIISSSSISSSSGLNPHPVMISRPVRTFVDTDCDAGVEEIEPEDPLAFTSEDSAMDVSSSSDLNWGGGGDDPFADCGPSKDAASGPHGGIKRLKVEFGDVGLRILGVQDEDECVVLE